MPVEFLCSLESISQDHWDKLWSDDYPFTRYDFLKLLEDSGATTRESGGEVQHAVLMEGNAISACAPLYKKHHSYGEYVFDWAWADAYARSGLNYYPKLLNAIPFTPATGARFGFTDEASLQALLEGITEHAKQSYSSAHVLFPQKDLVTSLKQANLLERHGERSDL